MDTQSRAKLLLMEIAAVSTAKPEELTTLLILVNEVFRDAKALALDVLAEKEDDKAA